MGLFLLAVVALYILGSIIALVVVRKVFKRWWPVVILGLGLAVYPFYDLIIVKAFYWQYARQGPFQEVTRPVDKPESVLWIDEVWPGFDAYGRDWMARSYLDGKHLQMLALNGDDGKIYLYRTGAKDKPEVFDSLQSLPPMRYHVVFRPVPLNWFARQFIHADEIRIIDAQTSEVIAFSRRCMAYKPRIVVDIAGGRPFYGGDILGDERAYEFDDKVLFGYAGIRGNFEYIKDTFQRSRYNMLVINNKDRFKK